MREKNYAMQTMNRFEQMAERLRHDGRRRRVAVARPADGHTIEVITRCLDEGTADFTLVADPECAGQAERMAASQPGRVSVVKAADAEDCARQAVAEVREGRCDVLMKGTLNTDVLLRAVLNKECGLLEKGRVLSHITAADIPGHRRLLLFSDAAVVPKPTMEQFEAITGYAAETFRKLQGDTACPHIALIHCTEKTSEKFPHTLCYAELKRQAAEGRYGNAVIDGPMDVKTAFDSESARIKGIISPVAGRADILVFPNIESANVFYKTITWFARALTAGMLCGTAAPVVVASRADSAKSKYCSLVLACAVA